ncbi:hypothetical protein [Jonesia quinghaiensis]|uniref:hypothetical protein n=1 Tax=Jonesia quinghaiensis TaxID=262806 RepID=UPI00048B33D9|nr:hypothetical protein [Jonesia quinghaiensis]
MSLFSRWKSRRAEPESAPGPRGRGKRAVDVDHLQRFTQTRAGVEGYIEPANRDFPVSLLLVATTGEWTRRTVGSAATGRSVAAQLGIPVYDVNFTGYPQRMRDWNSAQRKR